MGRGGKEGGGGFIGWFENEKKKQMVKKNDNKATIMNSCKRGILFLIFLKKNELYVFSTQTKF